MDNPLTQILDPWYWECKCDSMNIYSRLCARCPRCGATNDSATSPPLIITTQFELMNEGGEVQV